MLVFQEQVNNIAADQVSHLERNNIYLTYGASVLMYVLATSEAFVSMGCGGVFVVACPHSPLGCDKCYKHNFPCLGNGYEASCGMMLPSRRVRVDSGQPKEA